MVRLIVWFGIIAYCLDCQFLNGALVTESILRSLEEDIEEPELLQSSFADAQECSGKSIKSYALCALFHNFQQNNSAAVDECVSAAEIYKCGLHKNQTIVNQLVSQRNYVTRLDISFDYLF
jgi:hypothetical protein